MSCGKKSKIGRQTSNSLATSEAIAELGKEKKKRGRKQALQNVVFVEGGMIGAQTVEKTGPSVGLPVPVLGRGKADGSSGVEAFAETEERSKTKKVDSAKISHTDDIKLGRGDSAGSDEEEVTEEQLDALDEQFEEEERRKLERRTKRWGSRGASRKLERNNE